MSSTWDAIGSFWRSMGATIAPERMIEASSDYIRDCLALCHQAGARGGEGIELSDRRFRSEAWKANPLLGLVAAWYLTSSQHLGKLADAVEGDAKTRERIRFCVDQWLAAVAPSNFLMFNADAHSAMRDSNGESLRLGLTNLLADVTRGRLTQTDESHFAVGENLATTEGSVVYENDLFQLIQYKPSSANVFERPLLIVPPCINKFYILDLRPDNSLIRNAVDNGQQVFAMSWRNPDASLAHKTWDDYIEEGVLSAIETVREISRSDQINTLGFCIGGTLLTTALAVAAARGRHPAASMTLLTTMLDFSDTGLLDIFVDEAQVQCREYSIGGKNGAPAAVMRGADLAATFSFLRPNELVWNYVVDNYLKGQSPAPFDLLYWNGDSTNLPGPMYVWYLRHMYLENRLRERGALTVCGERVDLGAITTPTLIYASREDHIVPWRSAYASRQLLGGSTTFLLGASGHIAGVINPPSSNKRSYWSIDSDQAAQRLAEDEWLGKAVEHPGSWWPAWLGWLAQYGGKQVEARANAGSTAYPVIEPAPGRYVMQRA
jgi:polyhydroxyalkanoate synthase subunit PhaC